MAALNIISAGAAKSIVNAVAGSEAVRERVQVHARFGAVGAMLKEVESGCACDVVILTDTLLNRLIDQGEVRLDSMIDIGHVRTGIAVHCDRGPQDAMAQADLRTCLLSADRILCPDPAVASAGRMLMRAIEAVDILDQVQGKLVFFSDGLGVVDGLSRCADQNTVGVIQVSEIVACQHLSLMGVLPEDPDEKIVYSIAISNGTENRVEAERFVQALLEDKQRLLRYGFIPSGPLVSAV